MQELPLNIITTKMVFGLTNTLQFIAKFLQFLKQCIYTS